MGSSTLAALAVLLLTPLVLVSSNLPSTPATAPVGLATQDTHGMAGVHLGPGGPLGHDPRPALPTVAPAPKGGDLARTAAGPFPGVPRCDGFLWPAGGPAAYGSACNSHDEPAMTFYSDQPGSGGNVTWSFTLPVDGGPGANQSTLYSAAWFGLALHAPGAWMGQCYFELQFYPDSSWTSPFAVQGQWTVGAVGWQVDSASGLENPCFASPAYLGGVTGPSFLNLSGGDAVTITMTGWRGSPNGESVSVVDVTNGNSSTLLLKDRATGLPLDPLGTTSNVPGLVAWSPAGLRSVAMGFEIGDSVGAPPSNSYGGCNPGPAPPTIPNPAVPCPSYDPTSWANNTVQPWEVQPPTFFAGSRSWSPSQVGFVSGVGGLTQLTIGSNLTCNGRTGTSYCTYPWFSYSCAVNSFEFGATDYAGVSTDFGKFLQYAQAPVQNILGVPVFPATDFSVPSCGSVPATLTVTISGTPGGAVLLLSHAYSNATSTVSAVSKGRYSLVAVPANGTAFTGWATSGGATVTSAADPTTTLVVARDGTLGATFATTAATSQVWFNSSGGAGATGISAGVVFLNGTPITTLAAGSSARLAPGWYTLQAYPPSGSAFTGWSVMGAASVSTLLSPVTVLDLSVAGRTAVVQAGYATANTLEAVTFGGAGNGTVLFNGSAATYRASSESSSSVVSVVPGSYSVNATPAPGWRFLGWKVGPSAVQSDSSAHANVTIGLGPASVVAQFQAIVMFVSLPASGGAVSVNNLPAVGSGVSVPLTPHVYPLDAVPFGGYAFLRWSVSDRSQLWVFSPAFALTHLQVNGTGTVSVTFAPKSGQSVTFETAPSAGGTIRFNFINLYSGTAVNSTVANGSYFLKALPSPGYRFTSWNVTGPLTAAGAVLTVRGTGGIAQAQFAPLLFPVTFELTPPNSVSVRLNGTLVRNGETLGLGRGTYAVNATLSPNTTFGGWSSSFPLANLSSNGLNATIAVGGPGLVAALAVPFVRAMLSPARPATDVGVSIAFRTHPFGAGPFSYRYQGLPTGCASRDTARLTCTPSVAGSFPVSVTVTSVTAGVARSNTVDLVVSPRPSVTAFSAAPAATDVGQAIQFAVRVTNGTPAYRFAYSALPAGCVSANSNPLRCTPGAAGTFTVTALVTDAVGASASSNATLVVNVPVSLASFTIRPSVVTAGIPITFSAFASGGTGPESYVYVPSVPGCLSRNLAVFTCTPTHPGTAQVTLTVTDAVGAQASRSANLTVNPRPSVTAFNATPNPVLLGRSVQLNVAATGGTGPLGYAYLGLPAGCGTANTSSLNCTPVAAGNFPINVTVTDALGSRSSSALTLVVAAPPVTPSSAPASNNLIFYAVAGALGLIVALEALILYRQRRSRRGPV